MVQSESKLNHTATAGAIRIKIEPNGNSYERNWYNQNQVESYGHSSDQELVQTTNRIKLNHTAIAMIKIGTTRIEI